MIEWADHDMEIGHGVTATGIVTKKGKIIPEEAIEFLHSQGCTGWWFLPMFVPDEYIPPEKKRGDEWALIDLDTIKYLAEKGGV